MSGPIRFIGIRVVDESLGLLIACVTSEILLVFAAGWFCCCKAVTPLDYESRKNKIAPLESSAQDLCGGGSQTLATLIQDGLFSINNDR